MRIALKIMIVVSFLTQTALALESKDTCTQTEDPDSDNENISKKLMRKILSTSSKMKAKKIDKAIELLSKKFGLDYEGKLRISGVMSSTSFNYALIKDRKKWFFDATYIADDDDELTKALKLYEVDFSNGGFKLELAYRWVFLFVPSGIDARDFEGAEFGRGIATSLPSKILTNILPIGLEAGWVPGKNVPGNLFYLSPSAGISANAVSFPRMKFKLNPKAKTKKLKKKR